MGVFYVIMKTVSDAWHSVVSRWHTFVYKSNLGSVGKNVRFDGRCFYRNPSSIHLGNDVFVGKHSAFANTEIPQGELFVADGVRIEENCWLDFSGNLTIGENSVIGRECYITTHTHGYDHTNPPQPRPLTIGKNVNIGMKSIIVPNVAHIGDNVVIEAGSVVTKDIPDGGHVAGNPAREVE